MISKGTTHNNGVKLAAYMTTGKDGERADLWQLRGFGATDIKDAFRDVQIMAEGTKATQPFFHVQVRNRDGEKLTRQQFEYAADRIEGILGLADQPRAIAFHIDERSGEEHMHVAWSRIDQDTMSAKPMPFFKERLKKVSRELELHFGLEPVTNRREGKIKFAPTRAEDEQARRLGLDIHEVRNAIRSCWDRSDCGTSFQAALEHEGLILAQGEKRDFVIIDREGGIHALGKRIVDMTAAKIRDRLSDVSRDGLPTVEMAQSFAKEAKQEKGRQGKTEPAWYRDRDDRAWQDAVIDAAIDKEKIERNFVEPGERSKAEERGAGAGDRERELGRTDGEIRLAWSLTDSGKAFADALEDRGMILAVMSQADAEKFNRWERQRQRERNEARAAGTKPEMERDRYRVGELVVVNAFGSISQLTYANTGDRLKARSEHLQHIDRAPLLSVTSAQSVMMQVKADRRQERQEERHEARRTEINESRAPVQPEIEKERSSFSAAARKTTTDERVEDLRGPARQVWNAWRVHDKDAFLEASLSGRPVSFRTPAREEFAAALDDKGISFARVTKEEADRSYRQSAFAREIGRYAPRFKEGEIVLITEPGLERRRNGEILVPDRVHKIDQSLAEKFVKHLGIGSELQSIDVTLQSSSVRAVKRVADREAERMERATDIRDFSRVISKDNIKGKIEIGTSVFRGVAKTLDSLSNAFDSLLSPKLTPTQIVDGLKAADRREAEADNTIDFARYTAENAQHRLQRERELEEERQRQRERGGRER